MARHRSLPKILVAGVLFLIAAALWRERILGLRRAARPAAAQAAPAPLPYWWPAGPAVREAVVASIQGQLEAFRKDDYQKAVFYQSRQLRQQFPSVAGFRRMMRARYPQFARFRSVRYGPALSDTHGHHARILVSLTGRDGVTVRAQYLMILEDGVFRVAGVEGGLPPQPEPEEIL